ncbi:MAG: BrnT family toxin [Thermoanaerobaculia bacterium]
MHVKLEWDPDKASSNLKKHGVIFEEAATALLDPMALAQEDAASESEPRWVLIGMSSRMRLLTVVTTLRREDRIRLISARRATSKEAKYYA